MLKLIDVSIFDKYDFIISINKKTKGTNIF